MRPVRPLFLIAVCVCLVAVSTSCTGSATSGARSVVTGRGTTEKPAASGLQTPAKTSPAVTLTPGTPGAVVPQASLAPAAPGADPPDGRFYEVEAGDTLMSIANHWGVTVDALVTLNHIANIDAIAVGQRLLLPPGAVEATPEPEPLESVRVPILMYHHIALLAETAGQEWIVTTVTPGAFEEQLAYLSNNGYTTVKVVDVVDALAGRKTLPAKPVIITFDDGWIDDYESALPVLQRYGMIASFFIPAGLITGPENHTMTWEQVEALSWAGMEIGSHAMTHPYLTSLDGETLAWEVEASMALLEEHSAQPVEVLAYPFGLYDENVANAVASAGYRAALTINEGLYATPYNLYVLPRLTVLYGQSLASFADMIGATETQEEISEETAEE